MPEVQTDLLIHYRVVGDGSIVLWHNGGCGDGRMWELGGYVEGLPGYTHVLMDHRGRGRSEAPADMGGHHMSRYVADALAVLDDVGADRATFVGYSFGARVGFATAVAAPERFSGLVALDGAPDPTPSAEEIRADAQEVLTRGTRAVIEEFAALEAEPPPPWLIDNLCSTDSHAFAGCMEAEATAPDLWAAAPTLDVPALVVAGVLGDEDWRALAQQLVTTLPQAKLVTIDVAHLAAFHRTDLTLPPIQAFLERVSGRT